MNNFFKHLYAKKIAKNFGEKCQVIFPYQKIPIKIFKAPNAQLIANSRITFKSFMGQNHPVTFILEEGSSLNIEGDLEIGPGVCIRLMPGAYFFWGGKKNSSGAGVSADTRIIVKEKLHIGFDTILAWDISIMDNDAHHYNGNKEAKAISVGNNVWIGHGSSILKGVQIGDGSVIGAKSLVLSNIEKQSMAAGVPAKVIRSPIKWER